MRQHDDYVLPAIAVMLASTLFLSVMQALVREMGQTIHVLQITFIRNLTGALFLLPFLLYQGTGLIRTQRPAMHILRGFLVAVSTFAFFYGLTVVPLTKATVLSLLGIIFGSLGAVVLLGEPMRLARWVAMTGSFIGVLIILRPGFVDPSLGAYMILFSSITWGLALVVAKDLSRTDSSLSIIIWSAIFMTIFSFGFTVPVWEWPTAYEWLLGALIGGFATAGHFAMTKSLQLADASVVLPLNFTRVIWATLIGVYWFSEWPDHWTWLGAALIVASVIYISRAEASQS